MILVEPLVLVAPMDGWCSALDEVPDPVFAGKLLGDGLAIDPTSATLFAPCTGEVVALPATKHAVTLRAANGAEVLVHVGCDTVTLAGDGFQSHVTRGQSVRAGDALITFDLDALALRVKSLITPVIVMEGGFEVVRRAGQRALQAGDFLMELQAVSATTSAGALGGGPEVRKALRVPYDHGIHARPAALIAAALRGFSADVRALAHGRTANARSAVAWMELGVQRGDEVTLTARGQDATAAIAALDALWSAAATSPHSNVAAEQRRAPAMPAHTKARTSSSSPVLRGVIAGRGIAIGPAALIAANTPMPDPVGNGIAHEYTELARARGVVRARLERMRATASGMAAEVLDAHLSFIDDPELTSGAETRIARGGSAGYAWHTAIEESAKTLYAVGDPRVAERAGDLRDLAGQVLHALAGDWPLLDPPCGSILIGEELLPSQLVGLPPNRIAGFCTAAGGPTSHVALLAAAMNLPALVAVGSEIRDIDEGTMLILDADEGVLRIAPDALTRTSAEERIARHRTQRESAQSEALGECHLASGERIEIFANVGAASEVPAALERGAEGCGLLRTEFLFLDRDTPPDREEQRATYQSIVTAFGGRSVVIRTLDAGSDKPLRYLSLPHSENPALGVRGVRASLRNPALLREQLRAILSVEPLTNCRILVPMITDASEMARMREIVQELCDELGVVMPLMGAMIETPASALGATSLATVSDFFSIGSNDLSQYTLAMDRGEAELAAELDALHPAVLRLIRTSAIAARTAGIPIAVCGGLASDPLAAPLLAGLGVDELSAVPSAIPQLKFTLRALRLDDCRALAEKALEASSAAAVRALAVDFSRVAGERS